MEKKGNRRTASYYRRPRIDQEWSQDQFPSSSTRVQKETRREKEETCKESEKQEERTNLETEYENITPTGSDVDWSRVSTPSSSVTTENDALELPEHVIEIQPFW